jgi:AcrR family transcriptional regulator
VITLNGYERRTQQKKDLILQTSVEMFFKSGIANTSVADIASRAKVSKVTIFNYFESKENLVREAMTRYFNYYMDRMTEAMDSGEPFLKKLEMLFIMSKEIVSRMGKGIYSEEVWKDPLMQQIYGEYTLQSMPYMERFFKQGKNEGIIDPDVPTEALMAFTSMCASLSNPGTHEVSIEYRLGVSKLFFFGIFSGKDNFEDRMELYKSYAHSIASEDSD